MIKGNRKNIEKVRVSSSTSDTSDFLMDRASVPSCQSVNTQYHSRVNRGLLRHNPTSDWAVWPLQAMYV